MRILITGSRDWSNKERIWDALSEQYHCWEHPAEECPEGMKPWVIVSGACPTGADAMCEEYGRLHGWTVERHPADWEQFGKRAGYLRNKEMVDLGADVCLAFILDESKGATMTARLAEEAGIPTKRWKSTTR